MVRLRKTVSGCPKCKFPGYHERKIKRPRCKCDMCGHEFEEPETRPVRRGLGPARTPNKSENRIVSSCPVCGKPSPVARTRVRPKFRCAYCNAVFDTPNTRPYKISQTNKNII